MFEVLHEGVALVSGPGPNPSEYWISYSYLRANPEIAEAIRKSLGNTFERKHELAAIVLTKEQYAQVGPLMALYSAAKREQSG